jgi:hypothetical protein
MAPTVPEVLAACGATRDDFNNWNRRRLLRAQLAETTPGVARRISRRAALEVAFMAALTDIGFDAAAASTIAHEYVVREQRGDLEPWLLCDPVTGKVVRVGDHTAKKASISSLLGMFGDDVGERVGDDAPAAMNEPAQGTRFAVVHLAGLVKRIDALFAGDK